MTLTTPADEKEILEQLEAAPEGLSFDELYRKSTYAVEKSNLMSTLHRMRQLGTVYKNNDKYLAVSSEPSQEDAIEEKREKIEEADAHKHAQNRPKMKDPHRLIHHPERSNRPAPRVGPHIALTPSKSKPLSYGNLRSSALTGSIAMFLWENRNSEFALSVENIVTFLGRKPDALYQAIKALVDKGYIIRYGNGRRAVYRWGTKYDHPFPANSPSSVTIVKNAAATSKSVEADKETLEEAPSGTSGENNQTCADYLPEIKIGPVTTNTA